MTAASAAAFEGTGADALTHGHFTETVILGSVCPLKNRLEEGKQLVSVPKNGRGGGGKDSNPRYGYPYNAPYNANQARCLKPLGHPSAKQRASAGQRRRGSQCASQHCNTDSRVAWLLKNKDRKPSLPRSVSYAGTWVMTE